MAQSTSSIQAKRPNARAKENTDSSLAKKFLGITEIDFFWKARNADGNQLNGEIRCKDEKEALMLLKKQDLAGIELKKIRTVKSKKIKSKDVAYFTRQLATLLKAGLPLTQTLDIIARGHENPAFSQLINDIKLNIQSGNSFAAALRNHPKYFDELYTNLVESGEQTGVLDGLLERLATYLEKNIAIKAKVKKAMIYPIIVLIIVGAIALGLMFFVIPTFKEIFASFGTELPAPTLIIMGMSDFVVQNIIWILAIPIIIFFVIRYYLKKSESARMRKDKILLKLPIFGAIFEKAAIARWSRTLGTMFTSGIPIIDALDSVAGAAGNLNYMQGTYKIKTDVSKGSSLTTAMRSTQLFPNMVTQMVASGEESGALDEMLNKVGDFYEEEVDNSISAMSTLIEPILIVILGIIVCLTLIALYLPFFSIGKAF
jgi:type IV pilus assembly protein PilC